MGASLLKGGHSGALSSVASFACAAGSLPRVPPAGRAFYSTARARKSSRELTTVRVRLTGAFGLRFGRASFSAAPVLQLQAIFRAASDAGTDFRDNITDSSEGFRSRLSAVSLAASQISRNSRSILERALLLLLRHRVRNEPRGAMSCRKDTEGENSAGATARKLRAA